MQGQDTVSSNETKDKDINDSKKLPVSKMGTERYQSLNLE